LRPLLYYFHLFDPLSFSIQIFLCISQLSLSLSSTPVGPSNCSPCSNNLWILLNIHLLSHFPRLFTPPSTRIVYLAILSGSMCISPFSMNIILIQSDISSSIHFLGPFTNFLSTLLKESMYSKTNSIIFPSFTQGNQNLMARAHLLSNVFSLSRVD
jgi:hypothetical protein